MAVRAVFDHTEPLELALDDRAMRAELGDDEALVTAVRYLGAAMQLIQRAFELADARTIMEEIRPGLRPSRDDEAGGRSQVRRLRRPGGDGDRLR